MHPKRQCIQAIIRLGLKTPPISRVKMLPLKLLLVDNPDMKKPRALLCCMLLLVVIPVWAGALQSHAAIRDAVTAFVRAQTQTLPGQVAIKVDEVDRRLTLAACPALEAFLPPGSQLLGNSTVGVRCTGKTPWTLFVPVHIRVSVELIVANKSLLQGQILRAEDLSGQSGELAQAGLLTDPAQAIGKVLKFGVASGQVLRQDMLRAPYAVTQGQVVQIRAAGPGYSISSEGQALGNAAEGQGVQVKTSSGQVLNGTARAGGLVELRP
jgi:flagella basal body P-ring formation protein FlgA